MKINFTEREKTVRYRDLQVGDAFMSYGEVFVKIDEVTDGEPLNAYNLKCACLEYIDDDETVTKVELVLEVKV